MQHPISSLLQLPLSRLQGLALLRQGKATGPVFILFCCSDGRGFGANKKKRKGKEQGNGGEYK